MNISNNLSANLLASLYQGSMAMHANKMNRSFFPLPSNNAKGSGSQLGAEAAGYVNNIRTSAGSLSSVIRELSGTSTSRRIVAISSNPSGISIQHTGSKPQNISSMTVRVDQVATGQRNDGNRLTANAAYEGNTGTNQFSIETGGRTTQFSVNVQEGDTNRDVQQRMAEAINKSNVGVRATVETNAETNSSVLRLESTSTGTDPRNNFTVSDTSGNLVAQTGANDIARQGQNALYSVDGGPQRSSQTNTVFLGNGVTATLNSASEEAVRITWGREANVTKSAVEDMVKSYNDLYSAAAERTNDPRAQNLASRMLSIAGTYSNSLSNIGIGFDNSGRMTINSDRMNQAAESGRLDQFFTENAGRNFGFTNQLGRLADSVSRNPGNFVSSSQFGAGLMGNSGYTGFGTPTQFNFFSAGSLFDFMM